MLENRFVIPAAVPFLRGPPFSIGSARIGSTRCSGDRSRMTRAWKRQRGRATSGTGIRHRWKGRKARGREERYSHRGVKMIGKRKPDGQMDKYRGRNRCTARGRKGRGRGGGGVGEGEGGDSSLAMNKRHRLRARLFYSLIRESVFSSAGSTSSEWRIHMYYTSDIAANTRVNKRIREKKSPSAKQQINGRVSRRRLHAFIILLSFCDPTRRSKMQMKLLEPKLLDWIWDQFYKWNSLGRARINLCVRKLHKILKIGPEFV